MTRLALLRHGPTAWNAEGRIQGQRDVPLSADGRKAVAGWRLPDEVRGFAWTASPLVRAVETARLLGAPPDLTLEPRLMEMSWGRWEGCLREDLPAELQGREMPGFDDRLQDGESPRDLLARIRRWLAEIAAAGRDTLAVAHAGVIRVVYADAVGWTLDGEPPERLQSRRLHLFALDADGRPSVDRLNLRLEG